MNVSTPQSPLERDSGPGLREVILWAIYAFASILLAVWLSWQASAYFNFGYSHWYHELSIDLAIETYAPKNEFKAGFERTTDAERQRLFANTVEAIQNGGEGLKTIRYRDPSGEPIDILFTNAEVIHLQDVANLISFLNRVAVGLLVFCIFFIAVAKSKRFAFPSMSKLVLGVFAMIGAIGVTVLLIGPVNAFYWMHTKVFPDDHQWFFYYEESLMSLMMKAPVLFGPVALQLLAVALVIWWMHLVVLKKFV